MLRACGPCSILFKTVPTLPSIHPTKKQREKHQGLVEVLTPIAKGYVTDRAFEICSQGMQIYGGYGFIEEYPMAQLLRDCRITLIYEGTNGIQAMDLLGRKLGLDKGTPIMNLFGEMQKTIADAKKTPELEKYAIQKHKMEIPQIRPPAAMEFSTSQAIDK